MPSPTKAGEVIQSKNGEMNKKIRISYYIKEGKATIEECDMLSECGTVVFCNPRSNSKLIRNRICGSIGSGIMATGKMCKVLAE